jgi:hypothetical protein
MTKIDLTLALPDRLAVEAKEAGLLSARAVARLLREELRRRAAKSDRRSARSGASIAELLAGAPEVVEFDPPRLGSLGLRSADFE